MKKIFLFLSLCFVLGFAVTSCGDDEETCPACELIPEVGPCNAAVPIYYYDQDSMKCVEFIWGGCEGLVPFETLQDCLDCDCQ